MAKQTSPVARFLDDNGLTVALFALFVACIVGQAATGFRAYNGGQTGAHLATIGFGAYLKTGNFLDAAFSNWQAAVLQLAVLITFGALLRQKGATHSRKAGDEGGEPGEGDGGSTAGHSWMYAHSLSLAFGAMFVLTFVAHVIFEHWKYNEDLALQHLPAVDIGSYWASSGFWFSCFQCWEAEFAVIAIYVIFSIFLRQEASPESKPVGASDEQTGGANE
nr:DUF6766 family protein [Polymorphobacter sp.]